MKICYSLKTHYGLTLCAFILIVFNPHNIFMWCVYVCMCVCVCVCVCVRVSVAQLCLTLCEPLDYNPPGSSIHGILQAIILKWVAISFSKHLCKVGVNESVYR